MDEACEPHSESPGRAARDSVPDARGQRRPWACRARVREGLVAHAECHCGYHSPLRLPPFSPPGTLSSCCR